MTNDAASETDSTLNNPKMTESAMGLLLSSVGLSIGSFSEETQKALDRAASLSFLKYSNVIPSNNCERAIAAAKFTLSNMNEFKQKMQVDRELHFLRSKSNEVERACDSLNGAIEMHSKYASFIKNPSCEAMTGNDLEPVDLPDPEKLQNSALFRILKLVDEMNKKKQELVKLREMYHNLRFLPSNIEDLEDIVIEKRKRLEYLRKL